MIPQNNEGFDTKVIEDYRARIQSEGRNYILADSEENTEEYAHFYFVGDYEGRATIFDAVLYTLRLQHESEMFEIAEHRAAQHFPKYKKITYKEDENGNLKTLDDLEEEIGLFMAEVIMELEEDGQVKVQEHLDFDPNIDFGIGLDIGLHVEQVTPAVIEKLIHDFNSDTVKLDTTLYSFQTESETH